LYGIKVDNVVFTCFLTAKIVLKEQDLLKVHDAKILKHESSCDIKTPE